MPPGKAASQAAHASIRFLTERLKKYRGICYTQVAFSRSERLWMEGQFTKIVCRLKSEDQIERLYDAAREARLEAHMIIDSGNTVFDGVPTLTALAIGPDFSTKLDPVTGHLELF